MSDHQIELEQVTFSRGQRRIFDGVTLSIPRGKIVAVMGPSGTGKTTLLRLIGGQLRPDTGYVRVDGLENSGIVPRRSLRGAQERWACSSKAAHCLPTFRSSRTSHSRCESIPHCLKTCSRDLVLIKLESVGLRGASALMPSELSGGMTRRVALARAIALDPGLIMYDEPFTGLDPIALGVIVQLIKTAE
ncbi:MAG: ATP-binding cassette domain-containing protein [Gammaproteobacteria bacterium]|nr:ATP-binding cassette domain-containing protein [Gammaproteobacteria bacterium]